MVDSLRTEAFFQRLEAEHRGWLSAFDPVYLKNWEKLANDDEEAAFAEARIRQILQGYGVTVEPNESPTGKGQCPDFRCRVGDYKFYVEVTNIAIAAATNRTGIADEVIHGVKSFRSLNPAIFWKCVDKAAQCANLDAPALVAITTFHGFAAMASFNKTLMPWLLIGETKMAYPIDMRTGQQVGATRSITSLQHAPFLNPNDDNWFARKTISGLLVCSPAMNDLPVLGVLHPDPVHPFDPTILPKIQFGQVTIDRASEQLRVDWPEEESYTTQDTAWGKHGG